jgi:serine/threonine protein kinase/Tfp pilus assembly protein PilF
MSIDDTVTINNRYTLHEQLGAGGMGAVYRATDRLTGDTVALKRVLQMAGRQAGNTPTDDANDARVALSTEFRTLASLRHPNIITVIDYGFDADQLPFFTMTLLEDAHTILTYAQSLALDQKIDLLLDMLQALAYLHRRNIIHRDIKPGNVLVTPDGEVKLLDFGVSLNDNRTMADMSDVTAGTLAYMAPEMFLEQPASIASDLYAAGIIAYQILTGHHPYNVKNMAVLINSVMTQTPTFDDVDSRLAPVLHRLIAKQAEDRYTSAEETITAICNALDQSIPVESSAVRESFLQASRFVGREQELNTLRRALNDLLNDTPLSSTWLIGGESGVGKSRLVDELRIRALVRGIQVARGYSSQESNQPFELWQIPIRRMVLSTTINPDDGSVLKAFIPDIDDLLDDDIPDLEDLEADGDNLTRFQEIVLSLYQRQREPLLLILEDLQWANDSLSLLQELMDIQQGLPLMIVATYRDDERPDIPDMLPSVQTMRLSRLSTAAIKELSTSMLGHAGTRPELVDLISRETEGNVFFIVEVVRALAESAGSLQDIGVQTIPNNVLAGGIVQVIQNRLDAVPQSAQHLLKLAAIAGRRIDIDMLRAVRGGWHTPDSSSVMDVDEWLTLCANAAVIQFEDEIWQFAHDKLRETIRERISEEELPSIYRQVAEATEALYQDDPNRATDLADYWHHAQNSEKELNYVQQAIEHKQRINDFKETIVLSERAINLLKIRDIAPDWQHQAVELKIIMGECSGYLGAYDEARQHLKESAELARKLGNRHAIARSFNALGDIDQDQGEYDSATKYHRMSLAVYREIGDQRGITNALTDLGRTAQGQGKYQEAIRHYEESLNICQELDDEEGMVESLEFLGKAAEQMGDFEQANAYYERGLKIVREMGDFYRIAGMLDNLGNAAERKGDYAAAQIYYGESLTIYRRLGNQQGAALVLGNLARIALSQRHYDNAERYATESLEIFRKTDNRLGTAFSLNSLGDIALRQEAVDSARDRYTEALHICEQIGVRGGIAGGHNHLGWLEEVEGNPVTAQKHYTKAIEILYDMGDRDKTAGTLVNLGFAAIANGENINARRYLYRALNLASKLGANQLINRALIGFAQLHYAENRSQNAAEIIGLVSNEGNLDELTLERRLEPLLQNIKESSENDTLLQALEYGRSLNIDEVVERLITRARSTRMIS